MRLVGPFHARHRQTDRPSMRSLPCPARLQVSNFGKNAFPLKGGTCGDLYLQAFDLRLFLQF